MIAKGIVVNPVAKVTFSLSVTFNFPLLCNLLSDTDSKGLHSLCPSESAK